ncbi:MAG: right-handed parallel beta-helix repeat-containing protein, partial [Candidatus Heimdallarchaeota archaeon]
MTTHTEADIIKGSILYREKGYAVGDFILADGTTITADDLITIDGNYRSSGATTTPTIFTGRIEDYNLDKLKKITAIDKGEEIANIIPDTYYCGYMGEIISRMITHANANHITTDQGPYTATGWYDSIYNFRDQGLLTGTNINWVDFQTQMANVSIAASVGGHTNVLRWTANTNWTIYHYIKHSYVNLPTYGTIEFMYRSTNTGEENNVRLYNENNQMAISFMLDNDYMDSNIPIADDTTYYMRIDFRCAGADAYDSLSEDQYRISMFNSSGAHLSNSPNIHSFSNTSTNIVDIGFYQNNEVLLSHNMYIDAVGTYPFSEFGEDKYYILTDNLDEITYTLPQGTSDTVTIPAYGSQTLQTHTDYGSKHEEYTWALKPDGELRWHDMSENLGITLDGTEKYWNVSGKYQVKRINRVVVKGSLGFKGEANDPSLQGTHGIITQRDYVAQALSEDELNIIATNLLTIYKKELPLRLEMSIKLDAYGYLQVGEYLTIGTDAIIYNDSGDYAPAGTYRVVECELILGEGGEYQYVNLILEDGLTFSKQPRDAQENSQAAALSQSNITVVGGSSSGDGETNTITNIGIGDGEVYKQKIGVEFELKTLKDGTGIDVVNNTDDITLQVDTTGFLEGTPTEDLTTKATTSEWSFDHAANAVSDIKHMTDAQINALHARSHTLDSGDDHTGSLPISDLDTLTPASEKATLVAGDLLMVGDSDASYVNKKVQIANIIQNDDFGDAWNNKYTRSPSSEKCFNKFTSVDSNIGALQDCLLYKGTWDASTGVYPDLSPTTGDYWICTVAGTTNSIFYEYYDWIIWNGSIWNLIRQYKGVVTVEVGTSDSIQTAVDAVLGAGGGVVVIKQGTHDTSGDTFPIVINATGKDIKITGVGDGSVIRSTVLGVDVFTVTAIDSFILENVRVECTNCNASTNAIDVNGGNIVLIDNVTVDGTDAGWGIDIDTPDAFVKNCRVSDFGINIVLRANYIHCEGNHVSSSADQGIYIDTAHQCIVSHNIIKTAGNDGLSIVGDSDKNVVANNIFEPSSGYAGIFIQASSQENIIGNNSFTCVSGGNGIRIDGDYSIISGNMIEGATTGILINSGGDYNIINPNLFYNCNTDFTDAGTGTKIFGSDIAYNSTSWNTNLGTPTKNAIRDKFFTNDAALTTHKTSTDHDSRYYTETEINNFNFS